MYATIIALNFLLHLVYREASGTSFLVAETRQGLIVYYDFEARTVKALSLSTQINPIALAYDPVTATIFWSTVEPSGSVIRQALVSGLGERLVNITEGPPLKVVDGLAFDSVSRRLYYSDTGPKIIASVDVDGSNHRTVIANGVEQPRALVLVPQIKKIYWTDWGTVPHIARADMYDGGNIEYIVRDTGLQWPNGLAVDSDANEMFWCDGGLGRIEKASLSGSSRQLLSMNLGRHYFGIAVDKTHVYVTGWTYGGLQRISRQGGPLESFGELFAGARLNSILHIPSTSVIQFTTLSTTSTTTRSTTTKSTSTQTTTTTTTTTTPKPTTTTSTTTAQPTTTTTMPTTSSTTTATPTQPTTTSSTAKYTAESDISQRKVVALDNVTAAASTANTFLGVQWSIELVAMALGAMLVGSLLVIFILACVIKRKSKSKRQLQAVNYVTNLSNDAVLELEKSDGLGEKNKINPKVFSRQLPSTPAIKGNVYSTLGSHQLDTSHTQYSQLLLCNMEDESPYSQISN